MNTETKSEVKRARITEDEDYGGQLYFEYGDHLSIDIRKGEAEDWREIAKKLNAHYELVDMIKSAKVWINTAIADNDVDKLKIANSRLNNALAKAEGK
jgi:hypothetical protein